MKASRVHRGVSGGTDASDGAPRRPTLPAAPKVILEALIAPDVALYDARAMLPKPRRRRKLRRARGSRIEALFVHHSGADGRPGIQGAIASTRYVMEHRGFPGPGYHYWIPRELRDSEGRHVVLRLGASEHRLWHSGRRANDIGEGLALQGNLSRRPMTMSQVWSLQAFIDWWGKEHNLAQEHRSRWLGWHSIAGRWGGRSKAACPGLDAEKWLRHATAVRSKALPQRPAPLRSSQHC